MVDAKTGSLLWHADIASHSAMQYSIPARLAVADVTRSGFAEQIYVGDMGGQVWRFEINNGEELTSSFITGQVVADLAADSSTVNARRFYESADIAILEQNDLTYIAVTIGSGWRANPNDTTVQDRFYMLKLPFDDLVSFTALTDVGSGANVLYDATANLIAVGSDTQQATATTALNTAFGWYIKIPSTGSTGEKVLSKPLTIDGEVTFTTYEPTAQLQGCTVLPGTARRYKLKLVDASGALKFIDADGNVTYGRSEILQAGTIVDPSIICTGAGCTQFAGTEDDADDITIGRAVRTFWYEE